MKLYTPPTSITFHQPVSPSTNQCHLPPRSVEEMSSSTPIYDKLPWLTKDPNTLPKSKYAGVFWNTFCSLGFNYNCHLRINHDHNYMFLGLLNGQTFSPTFFSQLSSCCVVATINIKFGHFKCTNLHWYRLSYIIRIKWDWTLIWRKWKNKTGAPKQQVIIFSFLYEHHRMDNFGHIMSFKLLTFQKRGTNIRKHLRSPKNYPSSAVPT